MGGCPFSCLDSGAVMRSSASLLSLLRCWRGGGPPVHRRHDTTCLWRLLTPQYRDVFGPSHAGDGVGGAPLWRMRWWISLPTPILIRRCAWCWSWTRPIPGLHKQVSLIALPFQYVFDTREATRTAHSLDTHTCKVCTMFFFLFSALFLPFFDTCNTPMYYCVCMYIYTRITTIRYTYHYFLIFFKHLCFFTFHIFSPFYTFFTHVFSHLFIYIFSRTPYL